MSVAAPRTMLLGDVRARAAAALAPAGDDDPDVIADIVDAISPPVLMLLWDDPWLNATVFGQNRFDAVLNVLCLAARIDPAPGIEALESLVGYAVTRMQDDEYSWSLSTIRAPGRYIVGGVTYLGAQVIYRVNVTI